MEREQEVLNKVREYLNDPTKEDAEVTIKQVARDLKMPVADVAAAIQQIEFSEDVDS